MTTSNQISRATGTFTLSGKKVSRITNLSLPTASTEVAHVLLANIKSLMVKLRKKDCASLQIAYTIAESGTKFITLSPGIYYSEQDLEIASGTIYLQTTKDSQTVEILEWS